MVDQDPLYRTDVRDIDPYLKDMVTLGSEADIAAFSSGVVFQIGQQYKDKQIPVIPLTQAVTTFLTDAQDAEVHYLLFVHVQKKPGAPSGLAGMLFYDSSDMVDHYRNYLIGKWGRSIGTALQETPIIHMPFVHGFELRFHGEDESVTRRPDFAFSTWVDQQAHRNSRGAFTVLGAAEFPQTAR